MVDPFSLVLAILPLLFLLFLSLLIVSVFNPSILFTYLPSSASVSSDDILQTPGSADILQTPGIADILQTPGSADILQTPGSADILQTLGSADIRQTDTDLPWSVPFRNLNLIFTNAELIPQYNQ